MNDHLSTPAQQAATEDTTGYDLVVIGAGIAGLNALHAAVQYLRQGARVLLIDQKPSAGGMWNTAYDYVRLHQPHTLFTVGDLKWNWDRPRDYLAQRDEVRDHLAAALGPISALVDLETRFSHTASAWDEIATDDGHRAQVSFHPNDAPGRLTTVTARRAIYAPGFDYRDPQPLPLSSKAVLSIPPQDLRATLAAHPEAPVYVIGGGKTGMDTVLAVLAENPRREVTLICGSGTNFINRTRYLPTGARRWTSGKTLSRMGHDLISQFDGDSEDRLIGHFRQRYATAPDNPNGVFLFGILSEDEHLRITDGIERLYRDYLADVADTADGPVMTLRSGEREAVAPGSIFVNCTGSIFRTEARAEWLECLSPHDTILRITPRDMYHLLSSVSAFFMTHLLYRGELRGRGFYMLDHEALFSRNRNAWFGAAVAQSYMHRALALQTLPLKLLNRCALDFDRWYPAPRRILAVMQVKASAAADIARCRMVLDRVAERFGIRCAALT